MSTRKMINMNCSTDQIGESKKLDSESKMFAATRVVTFRDSWRFAAGFGGEYTRAL